VVESTAALSSKIAGLEDEMRIIKGEVKQVLTEIRSAILTQDNPFEEGGSQRAPRSIQIVPSMAAEPTRVEIVMPKPESSPPAGTPAHAEPTQHQKAPDPQPLHPAAQTYEEPPMVEAPIQQRQETARPTPTPRQIASPPKQTRWSLLTVASLAAWVEEAIGRLGAKRLALLLDLCEVSGYLTSEARQALGGVGDLEIEEPTEVVSPMEVTVLLRQLDALLQGEPEFGPRSIY
jgi:hypothetical protein